MFLHIDVQKSCFVFSCGRKGGVAMDLCLMDLKSGVFSCYVCVCIDVS